MIKPLTSLRFVFALMIFAHHISFVQNGSSSILGWLYEKILWQGNIGVSFFFILSGFILAYNYQERIIQKKVSLRKFYLARIARIYPLHVLTLICSIPIVYPDLVQNGFLNNLGKTAVNLTLTQSFFPKMDVVFSFNSVSWSISNEMFFYYLFPFIIGLIAFLLKKKGLYILFLTIGLISFLPIMVPEEHHYWMFNINPLFRVWDFIIGIILFNIFSKYKETLNLLNFNIIEPIMIILFAVFFMFYNYIPDVYRYSMYYWIPMSLVVMTFAFQKGWISTILSNKYLVKLGEISFGFYMIHQLVIKYLLKYYKIENDYLSLLLMISCSLILSIISYKYFERPANKFIKSRFGKREL